MSKFFCQCGNVISNVVYPSPTEGYLFAQEDEDVFETEIEHQIASFIEAVENNRRNEWIGRFFTDDYPVELKNTSVISDIITKIKSEYTLRVCECENCGRIHVQEKPDLNRYVTYAPADGKYLKTLKSKTTQKPPG